MKQKEILIKYVLLVIVLLFASTMLIQKMYGYDIWWHLKTGQYILEHWSIPDLDPFSYTASDRSWVNHQWFADIIMYTTFRLSGFTGLILLKTIIYLSAFCLLFMLSYKKKYPLLSMFLIVLGILAVSHRFLIRPFIFNAFFLSAYLYLLMRYKYDNSRLIFIIPVLHLFWANIHGGYLTGLILIAAFLIGEACTWKLKIPFLPDDPYCIKDKRYRLLFYIFIISCLVTFINPKGISGALYPISTLLELKETGFRDVIMRYIGELQPTITGADIFSFGLHSYYKWLLLITWISLILNIKRLQLTHFIALSIFSFFSITSNRNVLTFTVVAVPLTMYNLDSFLNSIRSETIKRIIHSTALNAALFIPLGVFLFNYSSDQFQAKYLINGKIVKSSGFGFNEWRYPFDAIDFIQKNKIPGNMFNTYESGGALIWKTYPDRKVFIDGRTEVYRLKFFNDYTVMSYEAPYMFEDFVDEYDINFALFIHSPPYGERIIKYLFDSKEWKLIYFDYVSAVFLKDTPENEEVLKKFEIKNNSFSPEKQPPAEVPSDTIPFSSFRRAQFFKLVGLYDNAITEFENTLKIDPELPIPRNSIGFCYYKKGDLKKAEQIFKEVIRIAPKYSPSYNNLGSIYAHNGLNAEAEKHFKKALELRPNYLEALKNLANHYYESGEKQKALKYFRKVVNLNPIDTNSYEKLGAIYFSGAVYEKAVWAFKKALQIEPERTTALSNLGITYAIIEDYGLAIKYGEKAVFTDPDYADGYYNLGLTYFIMGNDKKAREYWEETLLIDPEHKKAIENLEQPSLQIETNRNKIDQPF